MINALHFKPTMAHVLLVVGSVFMVYMEIKYNTGWVFAVGFLLGWLVYRQKYLMCIIRHDAEREDLCKKLDKRCQQIDDMRAQIDHDHQTLSSLRCQAQKDGDCEWVYCPQLRDGEPNRSGRHCPLDYHDPDEER